MERFFDSAIEFFLSLFGWQRGFMFAGEFFSMLSEEWVLFISGRKGSGKTLLAFAIADYLLRMKHGAPLGVWTNIPTTLPFRFEVSQTVLILDEATEMGIDARESKDSDAGYHKMLRKLESYLLLPSVDTVDKRLRNFEVYRLFDLSFLGMGWVYLFKNRDRNSTGWFILTNPEDYFHIYDTKAIPEDDNGLAEAMNAIRPVKTTVKRAIRIVENAKSTSIRSGSRSAN